MSSTNGGAPGSPVSLSPGLDDHGFDAPVDFNLFAEVAMEMEQEQAQEEMTEAENPPHAGSSSAPLSSSKKLLNSGYGGSAGDGDSDGERLEIEEERISPSESPLNIDHGEKAYDGDRLEIEEDDLLPSESQLIGGYGASADDGHRLEMEEEDLLPSDSLLNGGYGGRTEDDHKPEVEEEDLLPSDSLLNGEYGGNADDVDRLEIEDLLPSVSPLSGSPVPAPESSPTPTASRLQEAEISGSRHVGSGGTGRSGEDRDDRADLRRATSITNGRRMQIRQAHHFVDGTAFATPESEDVTDSERQEITPPQTAKSGPSSSHRLNGPLSLKNKRAAPHTPPPLPIQIKPSPHSPDFMFTYPPRQHDHSPIPSNAHSPADYLPECVDVAPLDAFDDQEHNIDPYLVDENGEPLRLNPEFTIPADHAPKASRIHGKKRAQIYQYSRLSGRMKWTKSQQLLLYRIVQQVPFSEDYPLQVVSYLHGEYGVLSNDLASFNPQHMKDRMRVTVTARNNQGKLVEGRARYYLPQTHPARQEHDIELKRWREQQKRLLDQQMLRRHNESIDRELDALMSNASRSETPEPDTGHNINGNRNERNEPNYDDDDGNAAAKIRRNQPADRDQINDPDYNPGPRVSKGTTRASSNRTTIAHSATRLRQSTQSRNRAVDRSSLATSTGAPISVSLPAVAPSGPGWATEPSSRAVDGPPVASTRTTQINIPAPAATPSGRFTRSKSRTLLEQSATPSDPLERNASIRLGSRPRMEVEVVIDRRVVNWKQEQDVESEDDDIEGESAVANVGVSDEEVVRRAYVEQRVKMGLPSSRFDSSSFI